jgi:NAD(P)-dependent dehydrogenase (short-subunit alcohol dehydrogenase family)
MLVLSTIVLNASTTSIKGTQALSVYSATKAAVRSFARNWPLDLKERKIRVNAVSPGVVPTPGYDLMGLVLEHIVRCGAPRCAQRSEIRDR